MRERPLIIYHANCTDGFAAAWAAYLRYGEKAEYLPGVYQELPPEVGGRDVLLVDFSYKRPTMLKMAERANSIRVFDHHATAEQELAGLPFAVFDMKRSGAGITWDELNGGVRPWVIDYVEDRDIWAWKLPRSKDVNAFIASTPHEFIAWDLMSSLPVEAAASYGLGANSYLQAYVRETRGFARVRPFAGYKVPVINAARMGMSELLNALATDYPFAVGYYQDRKGRYCYSLRSAPPSTISLSALASQFGGGGHERAAGFTSCEHPDFFETVAQATQED